MQREGWITLSEASRAAAERVRAFRDRHQQTSDFPWVVAMSRNELWRRHEMQNIGRSGLVIATTIDRDWQFEAQKTFKEYFSKYAGSGLEASMAVVDLLHGQPLAMIGGIDYGSSQFNRSTQLMRPFGPALYPLLFGWASDDGLVILPGGKAISTIAVTTRFQEVDRIISSIGNSVVKDRMLQVGLGMSQDQGLESVQGSPLSLASTWRFIAGRPLRPSAGVIRHVSRNNEKIYESPNGKAVLPGLGESTVFSLKSWLKFICREQCSEDVIRFEGDSGWNHWEIAANDSMVAVVWVGADRRPTTRLADYLDLRRRAKVALTSWLNRTHNDIHRPSENPPTGVVWHFVKYGRGELAKVPIPAVAR